MAQIRPIMDLIGNVVDAVGVLIIIIGMLLGTVRFIMTRQDPAYRVYRQDIGRAILLGLEFLVAGDIIRTVAVAPTMENVFVLALIVIVRTFLSIALQVEIVGRWPWQQARSE